MKILFLFLLISFLGIKQSIRNDPRTLLFSSPYFDKSIDPKLFSQANSYYSSLLRKLSQENLRDYEKKNELSKETVENNLENASKPLNNNGSSEEIPKNDEIIQQNNKTEVILNINRNNIENLPSIDAKNNSQIENPGNLLLESQKNNQSLINSNNIEKESPVFPSIFKEKLESENTFLRKTPKNQEKITEGSFFSTLDFVPWKKTSKSQFLKRKHHEKPPDFEEDSFEDALLSKEMTNQMIKEKVANLTVMVDEYLNYKKKNQENNGNSTKSIRVKSSKINKNMKKIKRALGIQDNYFENDRELYNFYGVIPHFISFNE